jgi:hypothetical protein
MTFMPPDYRAGTSSLAPTSQGDVEPPWADRWAANMMLVIQAVQRLHSAFDAKFVHRKSHQ